LVFSKILVPVDGSSHSDRTVEYASEIALKFNSRLILLHVYSFIHPASPTLNLPSTSNYDVLSAETINILSEKAKKDASKILIEAEKFSKIKNVTWLLREGVTVPEILQVAETEKIDMIVMGARGVTGLRKMVLGSKSQEIANKASCPVMIVK